MRLLEKNPETGLEIMEPNKSSVIHGLIRSIGTFWSVSRSSHPLYPFCLQTLTSQTLMKNLRVVRLSHTVRTQEEWMRRGRNSQDFPLKIIDFVYFTLNWQSIYHFSHFLIDFFVLKCFSIKINKQDVTKDKYKSMISIKGYVNYKYNIEESYFRFPT